jgi:lysophospholipase L1-like esterase
VSLVQGEPSTRRLATTFAKAGGGVGLASASVYGLLRAEALLARYRIGVLDLAVPDPSGTYAAPAGDTARAAGDSQADDQMRLLILGDSAAAGYGARDPDETYGAFLAASLAARLGRPVEMHCHAVVGAETTDLARQIDESGLTEVEATVIIVGVNDVTHGVRPGTAVRSLRAVVTRLRANGSVVVVGTCPDLGTVRPIPQPLRQLARQRSRRLAEAQAAATTEAGGTAVALGSLLGPEFAAAPAELFGPDRYHPSPRGYRRCAEAMLPELAALLMSGLDDAPTQTSSALSA